MTDKSSTLIFVAIVALLVWCLIAGINPGTLIYNAWATLMNFTGNADMFGNLR